MKKLALLLTISAGLALNASAQQNAPVQFGVKAGVTLGKFGISGEGSEQASASINTSFYVGGTATIALNDVFSVQPGLLFIGKGAKEKTSYSITESGATLSAKAEGKVNPFYLEVPVNFLANFEAGNGNFFIGAGPYYAFGIAGKVKYKGEMTAPGIEEKIDLDQNIKFGSSEESNLKSGDFGINFLAGYQLSNGLNIHAGYGLGLSKINNVENLKTTNRVISVGLGFNF